MSIMEPPVILTASATASALCRRENDATSQQGRQSLHYLVVFAILRATTSGVGLKAHRIIRRH